MLFFFRVIRGSLIIGVFTRLHVLFKKMRLQRERAEAPTETYSGRYGIMNERALWNSQNLGVVLLVNFFRAPINLGVVLLFFKNLQ